MARLDCCQPTAASGASSAIVHSPVCEKSPDAALSRIELAFYEARLRDELPELPSACGLCGSRRLRPGFSDEDPTLCLSCGAGGPSRKTLRERALEPDAYSDFWSDRDDDVIGPRKGEPHGVV